LRKYANTSVPSEIKKRLQKGKEEKKLLENYTIFSPKRTLKRYENQTKDLGKNLRLGKEKRSF
jgi:hypothetical protein